MLRAARQWLDLEGDRWLAPHTANTRNKELASESVSQSCRGDQSVTQNILVSRRISIIQITQDLDKFKSRIL